MPHSAKACCGATARIPVPPLSSMNLNFLPIISTVHQELSEVNEKNNEMLTRRVSYFNTPIILNVSSSLLNCLSKQLMSCSSLLQNLEKTPLLLPLFKDIVIDNDCVAHWSVRVLGWEQYKSLAMSFTLSSIVICPLLLQARDVYCLEVRVDTGKLKQQSTSEVIASLTYCFCVMIQPL